MKSMLERSSSYLILGISIHESYNLEAISVYFDIILSFLPYLFLAFAVIICCIKDNTIYLELLWLELLGA